MEAPVEDFIYDLLANCFNATDTAPLAIQAILSADSYDLGPKAGRIENPQEWSQGKILEKAKAFHKDETQPKGDYDD